MAKEVFAGPTKAAVEKLLRERMPDLEATLKSIQSDIRAIHDDLRRVDAKVDNLRTEMSDRFEVMLATVNEVSHRVTRLDGKIEDFSEAMGIRLQMAEFTKPTRKRRAV